MVCKLVGENQVIFYIPEVHPTNPTVGIPFKTKKTVRTGKRLARHGLLEAWIPNLYPSIVACFLMFSLFQMRDRSMGGSTDYLRYVQFRQFCDKPEISRAEPGGTCQSEMGKPLTLLKPGIDLNLELQDRR